jgi:hypothetical protein
LENYVTLFDQGFLPQGLALYRSLQRHAGVFRLWILCMDDGAYSALTKLALPDVRLLRLDDVETPELRDVKAVRSRREYCWTLTPFVPAAVFAACPEAHRVTYLDADTWLCGSPDDLFQELEASGKSVLITRHAFAPEHDQSARTGAFCVQFITFVRDRGETVRDTWARQCLEWCSAQAEPGRFGDQMYLDAWPRRFRDQVHVLRQQSLTQAPWNTTRYAPSEAALFHFHGLRILRNGRVLLTEDGYRLYRSTVESLYKPYLADLRCAEKQMNSIGIRVTPQIDRPAHLVLARSLLRRLGLRIRRRMVSRLARL